MSIGTEWTAVGERMDLDVDVDVGTLPFACSICLLYQWAVLTARQLFRYKCTLRVFSYSLNVFLAFECFSAWWRDALRPIVYVRMRRLVGREGLLKRMAPTLESAGWFWPLLVVSETVECSRFGSTTDFESLLKGRSLCCSTQLPEVTCGSTVK